MNAHDFDLSTGGGGGGDDATRAGVFVRALAPAASNWRTRHVRVRRDSLLHLPRVLVTCDEIYHP